ncbi:MAG: 4-hydroxy-2-oxovalerate aldolase, partial [Candidatus Omnitrophica bacterium]|nr:4-hydroxy-2-oxovalerate aldolase [Candidatus Omnitrophota bacterium]
MSKILKKIDILDTTLRDGNYAVDFQFTGRDTEIIALALEKAGFKWIEIGHGLGLNASNCGKGVAAATDREYLEAARKSLSKAKYGMFFIPGIGRSQDIKMASDLGMSFVRVGTNADSVSEAKKYISLAKKLGMTVFSNLMKSYALTPQDLSEKAYMAEGFGADIVCIVDSAGGMLPEDVARYFNEMKKKASLRLGFHGHNNLCLAVANTLVAIECGATIVDTSLQGLGRSSGNAPTETIATILEKKNMLPKINVRETLDISEKLVRPFIHKYGISPMEVTLGYAQFHSSFMTKVNEIAEKYGVDKR